LLVDTTSIPVYRPKGRFDEVKSYWDAKHKIYALKKEVAVLASSPHYAMFASKGQLGSVHDYTIHKETNLEYAEYLLKTTEEHRKIPNDKDNPRWAVLGDKAYQGPNSDTPQIRRLFIKKGVRTINKKAQNKMLAKQRVPVEQFFGRLTQLWRITRNTYRYEHTNFDIDIDNCILLTNEHIKVNQLEEIDFTFYRKLIQEHKREYEVKQEKRQAQVAKYRINKRRRLSGIR
jgi:hypothetical protein